MEHKEKKVKCIRKLQPLWLGEGGSHYRKEVGVGRVNVRLAVGGA